MNKILLTVCLFCVGVGAMAQTSLQGKITDKEKGEPLSFANVQLIKNGVVVNGVYTDDDGNYFFSDIQAGTYDVEVDYLGYGKLRTENVICKAGQTTKLNMTMEEEGVTGTEVVITSYKVPLIEFDNTSQGNTITSEKIDRLPQKSINGIVANSAGVSSSDGSKPNIRGSRNDQTIYFIDGIRTAGTIPQSEVDQLQLVTGGIEAKYGDVSGGVISLTSKGPSKDFSGGVELETSSFLDAFDYNLLSGYLSGPILKNKKGNPILGFRVSGQYRTIGDDSPSALGVRRAPLSVIQQMESAPFYNVGGSVIPSAERLTTSDIGPVFKARPNETDKNLNVTGKLDARLSSNVDLTLSGNYEDIINRFTPGNSGITNSSNSWAMLNWHNNPFEYSNRLRVNLRLRHKLGKQADFSTGTDGEKIVNTALFRNISYTLLAGYEKSKDNREDFRHEDRIFNYGYLGNFPTTFEPLVLSNPFTGQRTHIGYIRNQGDFIPDPNINPLLASYENPFNGVIRSDRSAIWSNLYANVGQVYNLYSKNENDLYTFNFSVNADIVPGSTEKGRHSLQFGLIYEQTIDRSYGLRPFALWRNADILSNGLLSLAEVDSMSLKIVNPNGDSIFYPVFNDDKENKFYFKVREKLNLNEKEFVNINSLTPEQLSLDMFSARELADLGLVDYRGYDYLGNKTTGNTSFEDFFKAKDADGRRSYPVAPFSPIYGAAYIQDKFSYKDIIFRIGLRADYYDANTKVFKDPYAIYEIESAEQYFTRLGILDQKPTSVENDYKVYVDGGESDRIIGYRKGDQWYQPNGTAVSGGNVIFNGGVVYPSYVGKSGENKRILNIQDPEFNPDHAFDDYKPVLNFMPRLAFSFPISEEAGFFAHYDVLYQRPPSNSVLTALDYFYFNNASNQGVLNNPNLRPVRTISYEAGFQQKMSDFSALKLSAYYKEDKDLIQARVYANIPSPISTYETYGNLDFGTTKGFSFTFDRRRLNNLEFSATYTLQFADGSGSDANSSRGLNTRGIIRSLSPLSFDERHRFTANLDFRYDSGKKYDGPKIGGKDIFANAGINLNAIAVSGQPFTKNLNPGQFSGTGYIGEINGSRLPWNFNLDLRIDKKISLLGGEGKRSLEGNIYLRVQNLLGTKNVKNVYGFSGDAENDGYLNSSIGLDRISDIRLTGKNSSVFQEQYEWRMLNPNNYFFPRRMYLGVIFNI